MNDIGVRSQEKDVVDISPEVVHYLDEADNGDELAKELQGIHQAYSYGYGRIIVNGGEAVIDCQAQVHVLSEPGDRGITLENEVSLAYFQPGDFAALPCIVEYFAGHKFELQRVLVDVDVA